VRAVVLPPHVRLPVVVPAGRFRDRNSHQLFFYAKLQVFCQCIKEEETTKFSTHQVSKTDWEQKRKRKETKT
jgi:hypothetical protein